MTSDLQEHDSIPDTDVESEEDSDEEEEKDKKVEEDEEESESESSESGDDAPDGVMKEKKEMKQMRRRSMWEKLFTKLSSRWSVINYYMGSMDIP